MYLVDIPLLGKTNMMEYPIWLCIGTFVLLILVLVGPPLIRVMKNNWSGIDDDNTNHHKISGPQLFLSAILLAFLMTFLLATWVSNQNDEQIRRAETYESQGRIYSAYEIYLELEAQYGSDWLDIAERVDRTRPIIISQFSTFLQVSYYADAIVHMARYHPEYIVIYRNINID